VLENLPFPPGQTLIMAFAVASRVPLVTNHPEHTMKLNVASRHPPYGRSMPRNKNCSAREGAGRGRRASQSTFDSSEFSVKAVPLWARVRVVCALGRVRRASSNQGVRRSEAEPRWFEEYARSSCALERRKDRPRSLPAGDVCAGFVDSQSADAAQETSDRLCLAVRLRLV
jgi:hypothetical protein